MERLEREQVLDDLYTVTNYLVQLRRMNGTITHAPEGFAAYYQALEAAYAAYGWLARRGWAGSHLLSQCP